MFGRSGRGQKRSEATGTRGLPNPAPRQVSHEHPRILLIDLNDDSAEVLRKQGYNVATGTFGTPYKVRRSDDLTPIIPRASLPGYQEQEVVVLDLSMPEPADAPQGEKSTSDGEDDWWTKCSVGFVDPRPRAMAWAQDGFYRILSHGGIFVVFADERRSQEMFWGNAWLDCRYARKIPYDNWSFLSVLGANLVTTDDTGREIKVGGPDTALSSLLREHLSGARFLCGLEWRGTDPWFSLATNKYGNTVAAAIPVENGEHRSTGWVLVLPQLAHRPGFLSGLLKEALPDLSPHLFPDVEGARWVQRPEYELPQVLDLQTQIARLEEETKARVAELHEAIEGQRSEHGYLHELIRGTGDDLKAAVKKALEVIGFQSVVDVDEELKRLAKQGQKREDLQIRDLSPLVLVETKGLSGLPKESDSLQVWKYLGRRMRDSDSKDIRGLSIVNHQRNLPALERQNADPFSQDVVISASENEVGLLTTWDLYRLVRSYLRNGWQHEDVRGLFYENGRILAVPAHYQLIGTVAHFWPKAGAVTIKLDHGAIRHGDTIAFELPVEFEEQAVESLHVDNQPAEDAAAGVLASVKTHLSQAQARKGTRVYRVQCRGGQAAIAQ